MPGGDGTGPMGMGSITGWRRGFCAQPTGNRWFGRFAGQGRGWRNRFQTTGLTGWQRNASDPSSIDPKAENRFLKEQAEYLSNELEAIRSRINEIEKEKEK